MRAKGMRWSVRRTRRLNEQLPSIHLNNISLCIIQVGKEELSAFVFYPERGSSYEVDTGVYNKLLKFELLKLRFKS